MFQPNSIKTLKNMKLEKSIESSIQERANSIVGLEVPEQDSLLNLD